MSVREGVGGVQFGMDQQRASRTEQSQRLHLQHKPSVRFSKLRDGRGVKAGSPYYSQDVWPGRHISGAVALACRIQRSCSDVC